MEFWKHIEILRNPKRNWLFGVDNLDDRINALNRILEIGLPSAISYLIPFLKDKNLEIRALTAKVIVELFKNISAKKSFYETVKHADISKSDIDFYKDNFSENENQILLAIASLNANGHIREKAVKKIAETPSAYTIQYVIYRLADWVQNVREAAMKALQNFKNEKFINGLVENIETLEWLQSVQRTDLSSYYADLMNFIIVQNKDLVLKNFKTYSDKTRIIIAKQLTQASEIESKAIQLLLSDKHFIIRNLVLNKFDQLSKSQVNQLLNDKSARVRYETLYKLKDSPHFTETVRDFIADNSATIREFARYTLKQSITDFASIYNKNLQAKHKIIGSISGLAETNGKEYIETITPFLEHKSVRIRKYAFLALKKLDENKSYDFALNNLDTQFLGLRNLLIDYFGKKPTNEVLEKARHIYQNENYDLKKSMLKLFSKIGKWTTVADLMIGTIDENENIRNQSVQYINQWKIKATSYFTQPKPGELERANQIFNFAHERHEELKYYHFNPLSGIDFYLK